MTDKVAEPVADNAIHWAAAAQIQANRGQSVSGSAFGGVEVFQVYEVLSAASGLLHCAQILN